MSELGERVYFRGVRPGVEYIVRELAVDDLFFVAAEICVAEAVVRHEMQSHYAPDTVIVTPGCKEGAPKFELACLLSGRESKQASLWLGHYTLTGKISEQGTSLLVNDRQEPLLDVSGTQAPILSFLARRSNP